MLPSLKLSISILTLQTTEITSQNSTVIKTEIFSNKKKASNGYIFIYIHQVVVILQIAKLVLYVTVRINA